MDNPTTEIVRRDVEGFSRILAQPEVLSVVRRAGVRARRRWIVIGAVIGSVVGTALQYLVAW